MARHTDRHDGRRRRGGSSRAGLIGWSALLVLALVAALVFVLKHQQAGQAMADVDCKNASNVFITATPEIAETVATLLSGPIRGQGRCVKATVEPMGSAQASATLTSLSNNRRNQLWIPNSTLWLARINGGGAKPLMSLAKSPVVIGTSVDAASALKWTEQTPTWSQVLDSKHALAVPDIVTSTEGIATLAAFTQSIGDSPATQDKVIRAYIESVKTRMKTPGDARQAAADGGKDAPLIALSERDVFETNRTKQGSRLVAVVPKDGAPMMNFPVIRLGEPGTTESADQQLVIDQLTSPEAKEVIKRSGFRDAAVPLTAPPGPGEMVLKEQTIKDLVTRIQKLSKPSRILPVWDTSMSMTAAAPGGTRIQLTQNAAMMALNFMPGNAEIGGWMFARKMDGDKDYKAGPPVIALDTPTPNGGTHRDSCRQFINDFDRNLTPGGTALYDTFKAGYQEVRNTYKPEYVNTLAIITDGQNDDPDSISKEDLIAFLKADAQKNPNAKINVVLIGIGPEADMATLKQLAEATDGLASSATDAQGVVNAFIASLKRR